MPLNNSKISLKIKKKINSKPKNFSRVDLPYQTLLGLNNTQNKLSSSNKTH
jgi:hypothetical protein